jgi:hypothetical protein
MFAAPIGRLAMVVADTAINIPVYIIRLTFDIDNFPLLNVNEKGTPAYGVKALTYVKSEDR